MIKFLNKGSYGKIFLIRKKSTKEYYAMKSIKIFGIDRYNKVSILNEIKILLINNNEFLLKCYDVFIYDKKLCIITEFVEGGDLDNYTRRNRLKEEDLIKIFLKICVGINALHYNNIIHRDIKPANILITKDGNIKICDFGICKFLDYNKVTNTNIGTPCFMSPEQMTEQYYDYKIDVWGIGCVLFYLLYNRYPFNGNNMHQLRNNIRFQNPLMNLRTRMPFVSNNNRFRIEQILREMFEKNKQKRMSLSVFLENSKELLKFYQINYENTKFKQYQFKSVPNTERDWVNVIKQINKDFTMPETLEKNVIISPPKEEKQPEIKTFAEIRNKRYNISPMKPLPPPKIVVQKPEPPKIVVQKPEPPKYPRNINYARPIQKIYFHQKRKSYVETLHRIQIENKIKERQNRIIAQQRCLVEQRKHAINNIQANNNQPKSSIEENKRRIPRPPVNLNRIPNPPRHNQNIRNRIKNVESKIKHLWAPSIKKTELIKNRSPQL